jgi:hypothetical protein
MDKLMINYKIRIYLMKNANRHLEHVVKYFYYFCSLWNKTIYKARINENNSLKSINSMSRPSI